MSGNLASDLERRAKEVPNRIALTFEDRRVWTFAELDEAASEVAAALAGTGTTRGARVATYLRNSPELAIAMFGCWKLGAVPVSISALYNETELRGSIAKTRPRLLLTDSPAGVAVAGAAGIDVFDAGGGSSGAVPLPAGSAWSSVSLNDDEEASILFTGGTTGQPKAVSVTYGGTTSSLARLALVSKGRPGPYAAVDDRVPPNLLALPLFHSGGQHTMLFAFHVGRSAVLWERFDVELLGRLVAEHRFDNLFLLPTMLYDIVERAAELDLSSVRSVLVAGQALGVRLQRRFEERFGIPIVMNYGSTETGHVAGWTREQVAAGLWKPGSAGKIYDGVDIEIRDETGRALPVREQGEICVRSSMAKEYVDDPDATGSLVEDGWVHSGDVGFIDDDGVLFLVGRKRDMIKCGGFQVWPEEIEEQLVTHRLVREVQVVGVPHERLGEAPCAVIVRAADDAVSDDELAEELVQLARERLAHFKAPREVRFVSELPRTDAGKLSRAATAKAVVAS